jgi:hypothetical protein
VSITIVRALDLASRALLQSEHPDAIEARIVLLELCQVMERYERPSVVPLIKLKAEPQVKTCGWCGKKMDPTTNPKKAFCCRSHRQRAYETRLRVRAEDRLAS